MTKAPRASAGFTLIEVMVVLLIIGVSIGFISLNVGPRRQVVEEEAKRLAALLNLAQEEAILTGNEYALELRLSEYRFVRLDGESWQEFPPDEVFRPRTLPAELHLELTIGGELISPTILMAEGDESPPRIYLLSSGEITPFSIELADQTSDEIYTVMLHPSGAVVVEEDYGP
ncbi:MAG: type II secretion system minor pseudopilin GspH [Desulfobulbaceae bacterium]|nr:type II secretion system minor pseudopilin GspH [Desulfobulbaceae bacterium]